MKKIFYLLLLFTNIINSQNNSTYDKIVKLDYDIIEVTITNISESEVEFVYPNETFKNTLKLSNVAKIIFKSGRVQEFKKNEEMQTNKIEPSESSSSNSIDHVVLKKNTIAVLPIPFVNTETLSSSGEMAKFAQNDIYNKLIEKSSNIFPLTVQDLRVTNSLLKKAGIDHSNIDEVIIEDLQKILGVDHIIAAKVSYIITIDKTSVSHDNTTLKKKSDDKVKVDDFSYSTTNENKKFDFTVYFDIYKNSDKIYTQKRKPMLNHKDSWIDSMQYLLKRCPIYVK